MSKPKLHTLPNGMPLILAPQAGATSVTVLVLTKVGSRYETADVNGVSHFIEHLMFKGTKKRPTSEKLTRELDRYGAEYNAYTDKDITGYYVKIDAAQTPLAIDLLHDMLFQSKFEAEEIDRERGVIVEEINMYEDNPRMHIDDLLDEAMYPDSTLGWNIAGPRAVIKSVPREKIVGYRDAYYLPSRMTVIVAGKVLPEVMDLVTKSFGKVKRPAGKDAPFVPFAIPAQLDDALAYQEKAVEQVQLALGFFGLPIGHADTPAANVMGTILGGTMSSRLFIQIRERRGLCYSISAGHGAREDVGQFTISAGFDKARFPEAMKAIYGELEKLVADGVTAEELRRAKDHLRGKLALAFEDSATQAEWYGRQWLFQKKLKTLEERLEEMEAVTRSQVKRVAGQILDKRRMAAAVIGPFGSRGHVQKICAW